MREIEIIEIFGEKGDLDSIAIAEILDIYGVKYIFKTARSEIGDSDNVKILTNWFILKNNIQRSNLGDNYIICNAYSETALKRIGVTFEKAKGNKNFTFNGEIYYSNLLKDLPKYYFNPDSSVVSFGDGSVIGVQGNVVISTIPISQFISMRNCWDDRMSFYGRFFIKLLKYPKANFFKRLIRPVYIVSRKTRKLLPVIGHDISLLLRESLIGGIKFCGGIETRSLWPDNKKAAFILSHDVDKRESVAGVRALSRLENDCGFTSSWYVTREAYSDFKYNNIVSEQDSFSHSLDHLGGLAGEIYGTILGFLRDYNLNNGFRAPWLHHTITLFKAMDASGYIHDSSIPYFEDFTPFYKSGGCMDILPFHPILPDLRRCCFLEIPVTVTQDYGLFNIYNLNTDDAFKYVKQRIDYILKHNGLINILTHPDRKDCGSEKGLIFYEKTLNYLYTLRKDLFVTDVNGLLEWCRT